MTRLEEKKLDEALEESFPASDPLPFSDKEDIPPENMGKKKDDQKKGEKKMPHSA